MDLIYRYDPHVPLEVNSVPDAASAIKILIDGNRRLTSLVEQMQKTMMGEISGSEIVVPMCPMSLGLPLWPGSAPVQNPYALVLGCSDARAPVERVFDQSFNDLFVLRIAGNVLGTECVGSVDFAVRQFAKTLKLIVVLGHTGCGAVSAAVETYLSPKDYAAIAFTHALRSLVDRIMVAVRGASNALQDLCGRNVVHHPNYKDALKEVAVFLNAAITAFDLRREVRAFGAESISVVYGVYDLGTLYVTPTPVLHPTEAAFADAPQQDDLTALARQLAQAVVAKGVLGNRVDLWSKLS